MTTSKFDQAYNNYVNAIDEGEVAKNVQCRVQSNSEQKCSIDTNLSLPQQHLQTLIPDDSFNSSDEMNFRGKPYSADYTNSGNVFPLDASFVQIPAPVAMTSPDGSSVRIQTTTQLEQRNGTVGTTTTTLLSNKMVDYADTAQQYPHTCNNYDYIQRTTRLSRIAKSLSDPPSLCQQCVQRYVLSLLLFL
jgi:hypothetical protein